MKYRGSCHCGKIAFEVEGNLEQVMECNCSLCSRRGYLLWFVPREQLRLATPEFDLSTYRFNRMHIAHHFCANCGCAPFGEATDPKGKAMAAVNVRCLEDVPVDGLKVVKVDGKSF
ncbi:aldehyde-activating protein [Pseudomonas taiwanensis]|uniref:GFA family protein n=1 Tax=Pseudomonas taiwanensis TaxID=470150 RepID=UPI0015C199DE|nr:GFA family protein [Pseudomonas taiwanensis]NWL80288.1 aldehyde-activating protein [Pseudomonas taiwanensis]